MPEQFKDFDIQMTVCITVKGSDYDPSDFDGSEAAFRDTMKKEAVAGLRHVDLDITDSWVERVEEVETIVTSARGDAWNDDQNDPPTHDPSKRFPQDLP